MIVCEDCDAGSTNLFPLYITHPLLGAQNHIGVRRFAACSYGSFGGRNNAFKQHLDRLALLEDCLSWKNFSRCCFVGRNTDGVDLAHVSFLYRDTRLQKEGGIGACDHRDGNTGLVRIKTKWSVHLDASFAQDLTAVLSAGAGVVGTSLVKDGYEGLKACLLKFFPGLKTDMAALEHTPSSPTAALRLQAKLEEEHVEGNAEVRELAKELVDRLRGELQKHKGDLAPTTIGVDIGVLDGVKARIQNVRAAPNTIGVAIGSMTGGELHLGSVSTLGAVTPQVPTSPNPSPDMLIHNAADSTFNQINITHHNYHSETIRASQDVIGPADKPLPIFGVKSSEHRDRPEKRCEKVLDLTWAFDGRYIRNNRDWEAKLYPLLRDFLLNNSEDHDCFTLALDLHVSLAFAAGSIFNMKSGRYIQLEQRVIARKIWGPEDMEPNPNWPSLTTENIDLRPDQPDLAVAIGLTHPVNTDVQRYCSAALPSVGRLLCAEPSTGPSPTSVKSGSHAFQLADEAKNAMRDAQISAMPFVTHLFISAPNAFAFMLGQRQRALGPVRLYEFDFEGRPGGSYTPSLTLPIKEIQP